MSGRYIPCTECKNRHEREYTEECDEYCAYAQAIKAKHHEDNAVMWLCLFLIVYFAFGDIDYNVEMKGVHDEREPLD